MELGGRSPLSGETLISPSITIGVGRCGLLMLREAVPTKLMSLGLTAIGAGEADVVSIGVLAAGLERLSCSLAGLIVRLKSKRKI